MVSLIIPTCNRNDLLAQCLDRLDPAFQSVNRTEYEIIVTDDSKEIAASDLIKTHYSNVKWAKGPGKGPAANRNNGAKHAKGKWLVFIDDDCLPSKNFISAYQQAIADNKDILAFEGKITAGNCPVSLLDEAPLNEKGGYFWSCNIAINRLFFEKIGMFDETFPYAAMEDVDLFYRIKKVTDRYLFVPAAEVAHPYRTNKKLVRSAIQRHASIMLYLKKHPEEKARLNFRNHIKRFIKTRPKLLKLAFKYRFNGAWTKLKADTVWFFLGFKYLYKR
ncbi:MAG TPA: glycosyltransferase [Parafilimonas sp.]|nr:glycosyltransferase [Parafilimonas sp.]